MARLAQKAAAAAAGAKDGTAAHPPESTSESPRAWEPGLTRRPDDRGISALSRAGIPKEAASEGPAVHLATGPEMTRNEPEAPKDVLAGRGLIGGLKESIDSLGARAAALSTLARRRSRELDQAGER